jgi:hypothetical protein
MGRLHMREDDDGVMIDESDYDVMTLSVPRLNLHKLIIIVFFG